MPVVLDRLTRPPPLLLLSPCDIVLGYPALWPSLIGRSLRLNQTIVCTLFAVQRRHTFLADSPNQGFQRSGRTRGRARGSRIEGLGMLEGCRGRRGRPEGEREEVRLFGRVGWGAVWQKATRMTPTPREKTSRSSMLMPALPMGKWARVNAHGLPRIRRSKKEGWTGLGPCDEFRFGFGRRQVGVSIARLRKVYRTLQPIETVDRQQGRSTEKKRTEKKKPLKNK